MPVQPTTDRFIFPDAPLLGHVYRPRDGELQLVAPGALFDDGRSIGVRLAVPPSDRTELTPMMRWFHRTDQELFDDDPEKSIYEYCCPEELVFIGVNTEVALGGCTARNYRARMGGGAEEYEIRARFAVPGTRSPECLRPTRVRGHIPTLRSWAGLPPTEWEYQEDDQGSLLAASATTPQAGDIALTNTLSIVPGWQTKGHARTEVLTLDARAALVSVASHGASLADHVREQAALLELLDIAYWTRFGYSAVDAQEGEGSRGVVSYSWPGMDDSCENEPLFLFSELEPGGFSAWTRLRKGYRRAFVPMLTLVRQPHLPLEAQFVQACIALEGIGYQWQKDENPPAPQKLEKRLRFIHQSLPGIPIHPSWPKRTADLYNGHKHYDRGVDVALPEMYDALLECIYVFRYWVAHMLEIPSAQILSRLSVSDAGVSLAQRGKLPQW